MKRRSGFCEALYHRRRYLPDINSRNYNIRSFCRTNSNQYTRSKEARRISLKIAMIELDKRLKESDLQATMLLQVHLMN